MPDGKSAEEWFDKGSALYKLEKYPEALAAFEKATEIDPKFAWAWYNKGVTLAKLEKYPEALAAFEKATEIDPKSALAWHNKGNAIYELKRYSEALAAYEKAIEIDPKDAWAWYNKGNALAKLEKYPEALAAFEKATQIDPKDTSAWYNKGNALAKLEKYTEALAAFEKAVEIDPKDASAWGNKGSALYKLEKYPEALAAYEKAIEIDPKDASAWNNKGSSFYKLQKYPEALAAFEKAIEIDPKNASTWDNKGVTLAELKRYAEALAAFEKAIEVDPKNAWAHGNLAEAYLNLGDIEQAETNVSKALSLDCKLTFAILLKGKIEIERKAYTQAIQSFTQAVSSDLGNPLPLLWRAYAQYLQTESSHQPDSAMYQQEIAGIVRELERAKELFEKSNETLMAYILYFLGCFYYKTGDNLEAIRALKRCVNLKPESPNKAKQFGDKTNPGELAGELLDNIWNYAIRPPLWRWWWSSPIHRGLRRFFLCLLSLGILTPLAASFFIRLDSLVYVFYATILVLILALPGIQHIRARDIEVELRSPPSLGPALMPSMMEIRLKELESSYER